MSETLSLNTLGTTDIVLLTTRAATATALEVIGPESQTLLEVAMVSRSLEMQVSGGPPGGQGGPGRDGVLTVITTPAEAYDPGDLTLYFDNGLI